MSTDKNLEEGPEFYSDDSKVLSAGNPSEINKLSRKRKSEHDPETFVLNFGPKQSKSFVQQVIDRLQAKQQDAVVQITTSKSKYFAPAQLNFHKYDISVGIEAKESHNYLYSLLTFGKCKTNFKFKVPIKILPLLTWNLMSLVCFHGKNLPASICRCLRVRKKSERDWADFDWNFSFDKKDYKIYISGQKLCMKQIGFDWSYSIPVDDIYVLIFALQSLIMRCNMKLCMNPKSCNDKFKEYDQKKFQDMWETAHEISLGDRNENQEEEEGDTDFEDEEEEM